MVVLESICMMIALRLLVERLRLELTGCRNPWVRGCATWHFRVFDYDHHTDRLGPFRTAQFTQVYEIEIFEYIMNWKT